MAMTRTTTGRKRRTSTPQQRAERARVDDELLERAARTLAGDARVIGDWVREAVGGMSPRILGYSLRNQMLLMEQAGDRGIRLTDVDTFRGWLNRGRCVRRGETGLRIIRPVGTIGDDPKGSQDQADTQDQTDTKDQTDTEPRQGEREPAERVMFRFMVVFDLSQTDAVDGDDPAERDGAACGATAGQPCEPGCACPGCVGDIDGGTGTGEAPGELLWNNLYDQITRAGYRFDWPTDIDGARVRLDHDTRTVHVAMTATAADPDALADIAAAVAEIITRADQAKAQRRAQIPAQRLALTTKQDTC
jgi:hypothetical protein